MSGDVFPSEPISMVENREWTERWKEFTTEEKIRHVIEWERNKVNTLETPVKTKKTVEKFIDPTASLFKSSYRSPFE